jgi:hypothetical protein
MEKSFHDIKLAVSEVTMLAHPLPHAHLSIVVDASASHVGACACSSGGRVAQPGSRWDLVEPLPVSKEGYKYLFTMMDHSTRWLEALPVKDLEAATGRRMRWCQVGSQGSECPADITSDRGTQFCSQVWRALCEKLGITHHTTTAYHPASNGMVERAH